MARQARIIGETTDIWGGRWDVHEERETAHGWSVAIGWPQGSHRGRGGSGGPRVIVTRELADYLSGCRMSPGAISLPIGNTAIKRLRRLLGYHWQVDRAAWWEERTADLANLTIEAFAIRHDVSAGAVANARAALFGPTLRPAGWWRAPDVAAILMADRPRAMIADDLGISVGSVGRLRWMLGTASPHRGDCPPI